MIDPLKYIISQYATSRTIGELADYWAQAISLSSDADQFYAKIFDPRTAVGEGLNIWGRLVGIGRALELANGSVVYLGDDQYRRVLFAKFLANISRSNVPALNAVLQKLLSGRSYVINHRDMSMTFVINYAIDANELALILGKGVLPDPAGVLQRVMIIEQPVFGFNEGEEYYPFDEGVFFDESMEYVL